MANCRPPFAFERHTRPGSGLPSFRLMFPRQIADIRSGEVSPARRVAAPLLESADSLSSMSGLFRRVRKGAGGLSRGWGHTRYRRVRSETALQAGDAKLPLERDVRPIQDSPVGSDLRSDRIGPSVRILVRFDRTIGLPKSEIRLVGDSKNRGHPRYRRSRPAGAWRRDAVRAVRPLPRSRLEKRSRTVSRCARRSEVN